LAGNAELASVILADDDVQLRGILRTMLDGCDLHVIPVADGLEAVEMACTTVARLVILDLKMPRLNGLQACERMRRLPGYAEVPIIMLSIYDGVTTRQASEKAGANLFLSKPISKQTLKQHVLRVLGVALPESPAAQEWSRRVEPAPAYGERQELAEGRTLLDIYRRGSVPRGVLRRTDWFR
jgi:CheY-like chemotaxis protein